MTEKTFEKMMGIFFKTFPNKSIDINIAWEMLKDIPDEQFTISVKKILATREEIYPNTNIIALIRKNAVRNELPTAGEAWGEVLRKTSSVGSYGCPKFSHDVIERAVDSIGWRCLCRSENIATERAHFLKVYEQLAEREKRDVVLSEGLIEIKGIREGIYFIQERNQRNKV